MARRRRGAEGERAPSYDRCCAMRAVARVPSCSVFRQEVRLRSFRRTTIRLRVWARAAQPIALAVHFENVGRSRCTGFAPCVKGLGPVLRTRPAPSRGPRYHAGPSPTSLPSPRRVPRHPNELRCSWSTNVVRRTATLTAVRCLAVGLAPEGWIARRRRGAGAPSPHLLERATAV